MKQQTLQLYPEASRFSEILGLLFPYMFRKKHTCRAEVVKKKPSWRLAPGGPFGPSKSYWVPSIQLRTQEGKTWIDVTYNFYEHVESDDRILVFYQLSRRFHINQAIRARPMRIRRFPLLG